MTRCRQCGLPFDPHPGTQGMYCSVACTNAAKRGKVGKAGSFINLGLGPRVPLWSVKVGSWERVNL